MKFGLDSDDGPGGSSKVRRYWWLGLLAVALLSWLAYSHLIKPKQIGRAGKRFAPEADQRGGNCGCGHKGRY